jgi:hypothetical protein
VGADTTIITDIKISRDSAGKSVIIYDREVKVSAIVWQNNNENIPNNVVSEFGLKKGISGITIQPAEGTVVFGGFINEKIVSDNLYYPVVSDFTAYKSALADAGLSPADGVLLNHSRVVVSSPGSNPNIMSNGIYDFILAYYNPDENGDMPTGFTDNQGRLPKWPSTGLTLDGLGLPADVSSRNIGGVPAGNLYRKGTDGVSGPPNLNFVGSVTVPMANYLKSVLHIAEFKNTNIIGDGDMWDSGISGNTFTLLPATNVGLIGDYGIDNMNSIGGVHGGRGVLDITGQVPKYLSTTHGYVNFWDDILRETHLEHNMQIVHLRGLGGEFIKSGDTFYPEKTYVVISKKYTKALVGGAATLKPYHRAFVNAAGQVKLTGPDLTGIDAKYLGSNSNRPVPSLDEEDWITAGNNGTTPLNLAANYTALDSAYKWADVNDFNTNAVE